MLRRIVVLTVFLGNYLFTSGQILGGGTLFSNAVTLKGALFADAGNIWNFKNTKTDGSTDSAQFKFKNVYKQLGVSAGTGFRLDFNYFLLRFDN